MSHASSRARATTQTHSWIWGVEFGGTHLKIYEDKHTKTHKPTDPLLDLRNAKLPQQYCGAGAGVPHQSLAALQERMMGSVDGRNPFRT